MFKTVCSKILPGVGGNIKETLAVTASIIVQLLEISLHYYQFSINQTKAKNQILKGKKSKIS